MRNDEFNKIEITNDKQVSGVEFGKTQKIEFTPQKDNTVPEGDLNEKYIGKTIKKKTEVNVEYMNKTPIHGSSTVVSSSTTATNAASAVASVATAASVVAVTVVAVGTGISVALHNYQYNFNDFVVTSNSLSYELFVKDLNNEKRPDDEPYEEYDKPREESSEESNAPLKLRVYNEYYDFSIPTYLDYNWGEFNNLKPEETGKNAIENGGWIINNEEKVECNNGDYCNKFHTRNELFFDERYYRKLYPCKEKSYCEKGDLCPKKHAIDINIKEIFLPKENKDYLNELMNKIKDKDKKLKESLSFFKYIQCASCLSFLDGKENKNMIYFFRCYHKICLKCYQIVMN